MNKFMFVDLNVMVGAHPRLEVGKNDVQAILAQMNRTGIVNAIMTHSQAIWHDAAAGNLKLIDELRGEPRLMPCWVMLPDSCGELPPAKQYVAQAKRSGVVAFRAFPSTNVYRLISAECRQMLDSLSHSQMPLLLDAGEISWGEIEEVATAYPELRMVICGPGYRSMRQLVGVLERAPNVCVDLANLAAQDCIRWLCEHFGDTRLMFGSGSPDRDAAEAVSNLLWSEISDESVQNIGRDNAVRFFGLSGIHNAA